MYNFSVTLCFEMIAVSTTVTCREGWALANTTYLYMVNITLSNNAVSEMMGKCIRIILSRGNHILVKNLALF